MNCHTLKKSFLLSFLALTFFGLFGCGGGGGGGGAVGSLLRADVDRLALYGATHYNANGTGTSWLYQISTDDGTGTLIGDVGYALSGMAYDPTTGKLYGTTSEGDSNFANGLIEIDIETGAGTPIGSGAGLMVNLPAIDSVGNAFAWTEDHDALVTLDLAAGTATVVGNSGMGTARGGMAFDGNDVLYYLNGANSTLYTIDTTTGAGTLVGTFTDLPLNLAHHGSIDPETGEYWGLDAAGTGARNLLIIDLDSITLAVAPNTI